MSAPGLLGSPGRVLRWILLVAAVHSCATGIGLLLQPAWLLLWSGWNNPGEPFFPAQGGVFHLLMAGLYFYAATSVIRRWQLLPFITVVKLTATLFLVCYILFMRFIWMVALAAAVDGMFALAFIVLWFKRPNTIGEA